MIKTAMWLSGAILIGVGASLIPTGNIGVPGGPVATQVGSVGFNAIPEVTVATPGAIGIAAFVVGILIMAFATSTAYKETGGY